MYMYGTCTCTLHREVCMSDIQVHVYHHTCVHVHKYTYMYIIIPVLVYMHMYITILVKPRDLCDLESLRALGCSVPSSSLGRY